MANSGRRSGGGRSSNGIPPKPKKTVELYRLRTDSRIVCDFSMDTNRKQVEKMFPDWVIVTWCGL